MYAKIRQERVRNLHLQLAQGVSRRPNVAKALGFNFAEENELARRSPMCWASP
jgi:hypothetical protein